MHSYFDLALDKVGTSYFIESEKDEFLNYAQRLLLKEIVFGNNIHQNVPDNNTAFSSEAITALVSEQALTSSASGEIKYSDIDTAINGKVYHVSTVLRKDSSGSNRSCRYTEVNDYAAVLDNAFKEPTDKHPIYRNIGSALKIDPQTSAECTLTVIRLPKEMSLSGGQDSELLETTHEKLVYMALVQAGINLREAEFYQMIKQEEVSES